MDYKQCLEEEKRVIEADIEYDVPFEVKSLFPLHEWESWSKGERTTFGRLFSKEVTDGKVKSVVKYGTGKSRHNLYIKVKK